EGQPEPRAAAGAGHLRFTGLTRRFRIATVTVVSDCLNRSLLRFFFWLSQNSSSVIIIFLTRIVLAFLGLFVYLVSATLVKAKLQV
uniref:Uncharacterized protein n=1 Tax=Aegilops tauschii subsp. strangulata TaxID=200361 RepID=A0A453RKI7_AEGTS